jgi:quercetin dioxygenase-like cupin family protein
MTIESEKVGPEGLGQYARRVGPESAVWYMGNLFGILARSEETDGRFGLMETVSRKGFEPPRHVHRREDEAIYVLEGNITFYVGDETYGAGPGTFVFLPRGVPHSFTFETDAIRMLAIVAQGGLEEHFRDPRFSEPAQALTLPPPPADPPDMPALVAEMARHGVEIVGPPGPPERG